MASISGLTRVKSRVEIHMDANAIRKFAVLTGRNSRTDGHEFVPVSTANFLIASASM